MNAHCFAGPLCDACRAEAEAIIQRNTPPSGWGTRSSLENKLAVVAMGALMKDKEPVPPTALWVYCRFCGWIGGGHHPDYPDPRCGKEIEEC